MTQNNSLDNILVKLGNFGRYQFYLFVLLSFAVTIHIPMHFSFVFTSKNPGYRCYIPSCDNRTSDLSEYKPSWLPNAVPYYNEKPARCEQYFVNSDNQSLDKENFCTSETFNQAIIKSCEDGYVYDTAKVSIANDFDIHCEENTWKLTMVGTVNTIGQFIGLPLAGLVSDKYGRRATLVWGVMLGAIFGIIRSFSQLYTTFLWLEFFDAVFSSGTYSCAFILGVELVGPSRRVLGGTIIACCCAFGEVLTALLAWYIDSWRMFLIVSYLPVFVLITYLWLIPESVRWLLSQKRYEEAKVILRRVADVNKTKISEDVLNQLTASEENAPRDSIFKLFKSPTLLFRFLNCCYCWITCAFVFYGLTLNSVTLAAGNSYVDFILTSLIEIPAYIITYYVVDKIGRRLTQCYSFLLTGITSLFFILVEDQNYYLQLFVYLFGKFGVTAAFTIIYIITSEVFPTPMRHSMMGACSMIGRIGSMVSPQMPLFERFWKPLPLFLFGSMSTVAGLLSLRFPETLDTKMPDTLEEAITIGKHNKKNQLQTHF